MILNNCGRKLSQNCEIMVTKKKKKMWKKGLLKKTDIQITLNYLDGAIPFNKEDP